MSLIEVGTDSVDIHKLLRMAVEKGASDLHLRAGSPPVVRMEGELQRLLFPPLTPEATKRIFEALTPESQRQVFYEKKELDFAFGLPEVARFRINACYQRGSISLACRVLPLKVPTIEDLGLPSICRDLATLPRGLVLVTGPTGSGKSATISAMINYINETQGRRVITIEDPIEYVHTDKMSMIVQRELGTDTDSFFDGLRGALRQDPNVIFIGEMRDLETMATALTAAETGHLVLSTLHTPDSTQTVDRIVDMFPPHQQRQARLQLSLVLEGVLAQVLLPRDRGTGRVAIFEVLIGTPAIKNLIREAKTHEIPTYLELGRQEGMQTMDRHLDDLVHTGTISPEAALSVARNGQALKKTLNAQVIKKTLVRQGLR